MNKLNRNSFEGLEFDDITFPREPSTSEGVKLLKLHGSFNWWTDITEPFKSVYYNLESQRSSTKRKGNTFFRVILPCYFKDRIYSSHKIYRSHIIQLKNKIVNAEEVTLVGKNFNNADVELNHLIKKWSSYKRKTVKIIDLSLGNEDFRKYHCELFNAKYKDGWISLEDFYKSSNSI